MSSAMLPSPSNGVEVAAVRTQKCVCGTPNAVMCDSMVALRGTGSGTATAVAAATGPRVAVNAAASGHAPELGIGGNAATGPRVAANAPEQGAGVAAVQGDALVAG